VERAVAFEQDTPCEENTVIVGSHSAKKTPVAEAAVPVDWPSDGSVVFKNFCCQYREHLPLVLDDVSVSITGGARVGIVGRTGSGKSTMALCLFRVLEATSGSIEIDGRDISKIGLRNLRSRLAIIPQDPVLFAGSIRYNLDPFDQVGDSSIWEGLRQVHIEAFVRSLPDGLHTKVTQGGDNFSAGQRQLFCFGRALLRETKVIVMDEATASVDVDTDVLIQQTIRQSFANQTLFVIAHRLNTVADADRVMVLDKGKCVEFDHPLRLIDAGGHFADLVEIGDGVSSAELRAVAAAALERSPQ
jgi:ABC-type multidrug transport system fused ATPase/permease subunit